MITPRSEYFSELLRSFLRLFNYLILREILKDEETMAKIFRK